MASYTCLLLRLLLLVAADVAVRLLCVVPSQIFVLLLVRSRRIDRQSPIFYEPLMLAYLGRRG